MKLTKKQRFYITINQNIINKQYQRLIDALWHLNELLADEKLDLDEYSQLYTRAQDVYK